MRAVASTPLSFGMCRSITTTSGWRLSASSAAAGRRPPGRPPRRRPRAEQRLEAVAELLVVVDDQDPQLVQLTLLLASPSGSRASHEGARLVGGHHARASELLGALPHRHQSYTAGRPSASPCPSSRTRTRRSPASRARLTVQARAPLWRTALLTASSTIRYAATSTAAGSGSTSSSASTVQTNASVPGVSSCCGGPLPQCGDQPELVERRPGADRRRAGVPRRSRRAPGRRARRPPRLAWPGRWRSGPGRSPAAWPSWPATDPARRGGRGAAAGAPPRAR